MIGVLQDVALAAGDAGADVQQAANWITRTEDPDSPMKLDLPRVKLRWSAKLWLDLSESTRLHFRPWSESRADA